MTPSTQSATQSWPRDSSQQVLAKLQPAKLQPTKLQPTLSQHRADHLHQPPSKQHAQATATTPQPKWQGHWATFKYI